MKIVVGMTEPVQGFFEFERRIMHALLSGDDPVLQCLRQQQTQATVIYREFSGVGFFTHFSIAQDISCVFPLNFVIDDVFFTLTSNVEGMAMLFIRNGYIDYLETVTITGDWPEQTSLQLIKFSGKDGISSSERNLNIFKKRLQEQSI